MRAVVVTEYGGPEVLRLVEMETPEAAPDCLRLRVRAAGVNPVDIAIRAGYMRDYLSPTFPAVLGFDVSGVVDAVGAEVTEFRPGDAVAGHLLAEGMRVGAFAEFLTAHPGSFVAKPDALGFQQAAAIPHAALTASQSLQELRVRSGDTVLIHAAAGGVGSFAVQLSRMAGARVIGTASPRNHQYLRGLGAEPVTYDHDLVLQVRQLAPNGVDAILDLVGGDELEQSVPLLTTPGRLASTVDFGVSRFGGHLVAAGDLLVGIAAVYPLEDVPAALDLVGQRHVRGKIVIDVEDTESSAPGVPAA